MQNIYKQFSKDTLIYGLGLFFSKSISFLLLPFYTRIFTPSEYGLIELITIISNLLSYTIEFGLDSAQSLYFYKYQEKGFDAQAKLVSSILQYKIIFGSLIVFLSTILSPYLNKFLFNGQLSWENFFIAFSGALFLVILDQSTEVLKLIQKPLRYTLITVSQSLLSIFLILIFILGFNKGVLGYFLGNTISFMLISLISWYLIKPYLRLDRIYNELWPKLIKFSSPLLFAGFAGIVIRTSDRWFLQIFHGSNELGIFAVGAKFALIMAIFIDVFRKAWWPLAMKSLYLKNGEEIYINIGRFYIGISCSLIILLTYLSPYFLKIFANQSFFNSWPIFGILSWQSIFYGTLLIFCGGIWKYEKSFINLLITIISSIIGLFLNLIFIPKYSSIGASISTSVTFLLWFILTLLVSNHYWKIRFQFRLIAFHLLLSISICIFLITSYSHIDNLIRFLVAAISSSFVLYTTPHKKHKKLFFKKIRLIK